MPEVPESWQAQNDKVRDAWDANAAFWDDYMGEGNDFQRLLIAPALEELLDIQPGQHVLEAACGNGNFARRLAGLGAFVTAFDIAPGMVERAKSHSAEGGEQVTYRVADATSSQQLLALAGHEPYDAIVCNMGLMDMAAIEPLIAAGRRLLNPGRPFIFSVMHPCFNSVLTNLMAENAYESDGLEHMRYWLKVTGYKDPLVAYGEALRGQPALQLYFHRPLELLFGAFFSAGYTLDGLREPAFAGDGTPNKRPNWDQMPGIPPVLVARMRCRSSADEKRISGLRLIHLAVCYPLAIRC